MSDYGYQPKPINFLNQKLTLSPETQAIIAEIEARLAARAWMDAMAAPKWDQLLPLFQHAILRPTPLPQTPGWLTAGPAEAAPAEPDPGPSTPHPGEAKDVLEAFYQLSIVQRQVVLVQAEVKRQFRVLQVEWKAAPTGEKVMMVTSSVVVAGAFLAPILAVRETRQLAFDLIKDKWLPVPGLEGYKIKLMENGAGVTAPLPLTGLTVEAESQFLQSGVKPTTIMFQFDLMAFGRKK